MRSEQKGQDAYWLTDWLTDLYKPDNQFKHSPIKYRKSFSSTGPRPSCDKTWESTLSLVQQLLRLQLQRHKADQTSFATKMWQRPRDLNLVYQTVIPGQRLNNKTWCPLWC